jgi:heat shock transcription factor
MYGFHKVPHLQHGVLYSDSDSEQWEFSNPHFQRNQPDLLLLVTRKKGRETEDKELNTNTSGTTSSNGASTSSSSTHLDLQHIMEEIQVIKQHQMNISSQLKNIQNDNSILWQETISARERHQRHQDTIDKILRFLASVFSNDKSMAIPRKRRYLLEAPDTTDTKNQQDIEYQPNANNSNNNRNVNSNSSSSSDDNRGRPTKIQKTRAKPEFRLEDFVSGLQECDETISPQQQCQYEKSTNPNSDLADAIALNDKSKQSSCKPEKKKNSETDLINRIVL